MALVTDEAENLREALRWTRDAEPQRHARLIGAAAWWFRFSGRVAEAVPELDSALEVATEPTLRARLFMWRNYWSTFSRNEGRGPDIGRAGLDAARQYGEARDVIVGLFGLTTAHVMRGENELALARALEVQELARELGEPV